MIRAGGTVSAVITIGAIISRVAFGANGHVLGHQFIVIREAAQATDLRERQLLIAGVVHDGAGDAEGGEG